MYPPPLPGKQLSAVISILEVDMYKYLSIKTLPPAKDMASHIHITVQIHTVKQIKYSIYRIWVQRTAKTTVFSKNYREYIIILVGLKLISNFLTLVLFPEDR
jgi:hypothetical protein